MRHAGSRIWVDSRVFYSRQPVHPTELCKLGGCRARYYAFTVKFNSSGNIAIGLANAMAGLYHGAADKKEDRY
jgi:hypothetical protein